MKFFSNQAEYALSDRGAMLLLGLALFLAYAPALLNGFVWDDTQIIVNNMVNRDWANLSKVLLGPDVVFTDDVASYYRPLNRLLYAIEYHLYGLNPFGYHLLSLLLHLGNVILLFSFGKKVFPSGTAAFVAALIFAVHPANAEAVNFISGRNNLSATFFILGTLLLFHIGRERKNTTLTLMSILSFLCGLLCKEIALMLLPLLFFYPFHTEGAKKLNFQERFMYLYPFMIAALLYLLLRYAALSQIVTQPGTGSGLWQRLAMNLYIVPVYASLIFIPFGYKVHYSLPTGIWQYLAWIIPFWCALAYCCYLLLRNGSKITTFALLWLFWNYLPISNIIEIPSNAMAERYIYFQFIGVWLLVGAAVGHLVARGLTIKKLFSLAAGVALLLALISALRSLEWKNDLTLFSALVAKDPESAYGHYNLGGWYREHNDLLKARYHWEQTVALQPRNTKALSQLGSVAYVEKRLTDAERLYRQALDADNSNAEAHFNLAMILEGDGRFAEALLHYQLFLRRVPAEYSGLVPEVTARVTRLQGRQ